MSRLSVLVAFGALSVAVFLLGRDINELKSTQAELDTMLAHFEDPPCSQKLRHYCFAEQYPTVYSKTHNRLCRPLWTTCEENK